MLGLGIGEIILIALIALVLFGDKDLPENMRKCIKWFHQMRQISQQAQTSLWEVRQDITRSLMLEETKKLQEEHAPIKDLATDLQEQILKPLDPTPLEPIEPIKDEATQQKP